MSLKDWKKLSHLGMNDDITEYHNTKTRVMIVNRKGYNNVTIWSPSRNITKERKFKTEAAKIKFINLYMRKH